MMIPTVCHQAKETGLFSRSTQFLFFPLSVRQTGGSVSIFYRRKVVKRQEELQEHQITTVVTSNDDKEDDGGSDFVFYRNRV